ncbi:hypothetical protein FACS189472_03320 [Alphaproteobacteria bacterium]|nr:hypothetical protein FACS189472_03320 [Alphaproteobacteria bacterium]
MTKEQSAAAYHKYRECYREVENLEIPGRPYTADQKDKMMTALWFRELKNTLRTGKSILAYICMEYAWRDSVKSCHTIQLTVDEKNTIMRDGVLDLPLPDLYAYPMGLCGVKVDAANLNRYYREVAELI